ncbi:hypothetical protein ST47_g19 [Ascochyta rabiei]|uniref:Uncharacterized protein n=1 Tax=Didymella rabiei TaxID=5454 RepID=A0A163MMK1_DIDRA|nr:hypothetical protein ST47_g19 [Ascochyta rabiei]
MDGRKRPTATRSRGNSPPSQRRRQSEQSSIADRYANTASSRNLPSPPYSRKNSAAGLPANAWPGSTSYAARERRVDQNRPNSNRNVSHSFEKPQSDATTASPRTASIGRSPLHTISPISHGSGSNTPMQAAPEVPSILPVTQELPTSYSTIRESLNIDTLNFLRSRKVLNATNVSQGTAGTAAIEVRTLKVQLRLVQLGEANLQTRVKKLENQVEEFKTLPAQLAALKAQFERQDRAAAPTVPSDDIARRLSALESSKPTVQTDLASIKEDIKGVKEQQQAMKPDVVEDTIKTALQPEIKKLDAFRTEHTKTLESMSKKLEANQRVCDDLDKRNLPGQLWILQTKVTDINSNVDKTEKKVTTLEGGLKDLHTFNDNLSDDICDYIGPIKRAYTSANQTTILQRIENQEEESRLRRKEQERLYNEQQRLCTKVDDLANPTDSLSKRLEDMKTIVSSLGEDTQGLANRVDIFDDRVSASERIVNQVKSLESEQMKLSKEQNKIKDRVTKLETASRQAIVPNFNVEDNHVARTPFSYDVHDIQLRLQSVENRINGETGLAQIIDEVQDDIARMEEQAHNNTRDIELCRSKFVSIFDQNFDPFRNAVTQQLETLSQCITHNSESLSKLEEQVATQQIGSSAPGLTATQLADFEQALTLLQNAVKNEAEYRDIVVQDLKQQLAYKLDTTSATQAIDTVKAAVRNLQDQYNNITTDDLHAKMVHWFLQQYPSTPANLVQKFAGLQQEVAQLRDLANQTNWDPRSIQILNALARVGPQLQALVRSPSGSNGSPETLAKTNEELTTMKEAIAKAQWQTEGLSRTVSGLQTSMHALRSGSTPFATTESVAVLQQSMGTLQAEVTAALKEERRARNELAAKAGTVHKDLVEANNSIAKSMNRRFEELQNGKIRAVCEQVESLEQALTTIRIEFDEMLDKFLTPTNKVLLSRLPALLIVTGQLQDLLESLNQNLPKGPLEFTWHHDFNADLSAMPAPQGGESHRGESK